MNFVSLSWINNKPDSRSALVTILYAIRIIVINPKHFGYFEMLLEHDFCMVKGVTYVLVGSQMVKIYDIARIKLFDIYLDLFKNPKITTAN